MFKQKETDMTQYEKNPNGGYLNKSNYGEDSWYGAVTITPELMAQSQATGKVLIEVKDVQTTQYGECRRTVAKPWVAKAAPVGQPAQTYAAPTPGQQAQPVYAQAPAPVQQAPVAPTITDDDLPF